MLKTKFFYLSVLLLGFLSIANSFYWIITTYHALPFLDAWEMPYLYQKYQLGELTFYDLMVNHNQHRLFIPRLFYLVDYVFFNGSQIFLISCIILLHLLFALFFTRIFVFPLINDNKHRALIFILISAVMLSPIQLANLAMGFNIQYILSFLSALIAFTLANQLPFYFSLRYIFGLLLSALVGLLSLANGLLILPIVVFILIKNKQSKQSILFFSFFSVLFIMGYFTHYQSAGEQSYLQYFLNHPLDFIYYISVLSANIFQFFGSKIEAIIGFLILSLASFLLLFWLFKATKNQVNILFLMLLYILISLAMIAVSRLEIGVYFANASRYTTATLILFLVLLFIPAYLFKIKQNITPFLCFLIMISFLGSNKAKQDFQQRLLIKQQITLEQQQGILSNKTLGKSFPNPELIHPLIDYLYQQKLSAFR